MTEQETATFVGRQILTDGALLIAGASVAFRVQRLKPSIVLLTVSGRSKGPEDAAAERTMLQELEREIQVAGAITIFVDMRDSSMMAAQSRDVATDWMRTRKRQILASHVLVRSKLVEMAMSVMAMIVGGGLLRVYSRVPDFMKAVHGAAPELTALPTIAQLSA